MIDGELALRLAIGVIGAAVLLRGARIYRPALAMAAFGAGAVGTVALLGAIEPWVAQAADPTVIVAGAVVGGTLAALVIRVAHRVGLAVVGGLVGATVGAAVAHAFASAAWWAGPVGGLIGALGAPWLYDKMLPITTPAAGAALIAFAGGWTDHLLAILGLFGVGVVAQLAPQRAPAEADDE